MQLMQFQERAGRESLQAALQAPDPEVRRRAIEGYVTQFGKSPFALQWPQVLGPGTTQVVPRDPYDRSTTTPSAPQDVNAPGGGLTAPVTAQGPGPTPTTITRQLPGPQQYWVPPVDLAQRTYQDVFGNNPKAAGFLTELQREGIPLDVPIGQILANPIMAAQVEQIAKTLTGWGPTTPGGAAPGAPATQPPGGPAAPVAGPPTLPAPGPAPTAPQVTAPRGQPQGTAPSGPPAAAEAERINPAIVASAQGKNAFTMTAAEALEAGGFPLTPKEEAEWGGIPSRDYQNLAALQSAVLQRRQQEAGIAETTATRKLREAETTEREQTMARTQLKDKQDFYRGKAFGILFDNLPDAAARIAQMTPQMIKDKVEPEFVMGEARTMVNTARTGQAIPIPLKGPQGKPITVYMTGAEYRRMQQEDERLALTRGAERVNQIKRQILEPVIKQYGYDTSKWPDDARVLIGIEPKPTSPLAILQMATRLAQSDLRFTAAPDQASRNAIIHEYIDTIRAGLEEVKPTKPGTPGPAAPGAAGTKPPPVPLDPAVAALVKELKGPQAPALQAAGALGAWLQRTFAEMPPVGTPEDAVILMRLERAWPGLAPAQRTQLATALPIQPAMVAWLDRHAAGPTGPSGPGAPPAASPGTRQPPKSPAQGGPPQELTMAAIRQRAAEKGISVATALAQAKKDGYVIKP